MKPIHILLIATLAACGGGHYSEFPEDYSYSGNIAYQQVGPDCVFESVQQGANTSKDFDNNYNEIYKNTSCKDIAKTILNPNKQSGDANAAQSFVPTQQMPAATQQYYAPAQQQQQQYSAPANNSARGGRNVEISISIM